MNLNKKLSKLGMEQVREFTQEEVRIVAENVTNKLTNAFPILDSQYNEILAKLLYCKMYFVENKGNINISNVNYLYENHSIIYEKGIDIRKINDKIIHECLHFIQDARATNDKLNKIGLFHFNELSLNGLGINEASDQYISSKSMGNFVDIVNKYDIIFKTISPNYYPILTNLIYQIMFLIGENIVVEGTINPKSKFEDIFLNTFEEKANTIRKSFDNIIIFNNNLIKEKNKKNINELKLKKITGQIRDEYFKAQNLIMTTYFKKMLKQINTIDEVKINVAKLENYGYWMGIDKNAPNIEYENFKEIMLHKFDDKMIEIYRKNSRNTLLVISNNKIVRFFKKLIKINKLVGLLDEAILMRQKIISMIFCANQGFIVHSPHLRSLFATLPYSFIKHQAMNLLTCNKKIQFYLNIY